MNNTCHDLIQEEKFHEAYELANNIYLQTKNERDLMIRANCLMFIKDYQRALEDYLQIINNKEPKFKSDGDYIKAGIAYWLIGNFDTAVDMWKEGLDKSIVYTSNIGNVPALLYFASAYLNDKKLLTVANKYLKRIWKNRVTLAGYLLNEVTEEELINSVTIQPVLRERQLCKVYFYIAAHHLMDEDLSSYKSYLEKCITIKGRFLEFEYNLAIGEMDKIIKNYL